MCKSCRFFDSSTSLSYWCKLLCLPLREDSDPCIMFESCDSKANKLKPAMQLSLAPTKSVHPQPKKGSSNVRIKVFN